MVGSGILILRDFNLPNATWNADKYFLVTFSSHNLHDLAATNDLKQLNSVFKWCNICLRYFLVVPRIGGRLEMNHSRSTKGLGLTITENLNSVNIIKSWLIRPSSLLLTKETPIRRPLIDREVLLTIYFGCYQGVV